MSHMFESLTLFWSGVILGAVLMIPVFKLADWCERRRVREMQPAVKVPLDGSKVLIDSQELERLRHECAAYVKIINATKIDSKAIATAAAQGALAAVVAQSRKGGETAKAALVVRKRAKGIIEQVFNDDPLPHVERPERVREC